MSRKQFSGKETLCQDSVSFDSVDRWPKDSPLDDQFALVLLKKKRWIGPAYYLEYRKNDPVYGNRIGLFGGTRQPNETPRATAVREISEETGLALGGTKLRKLAYIEGETNLLSEAEGFIYIYEFDRSDERVSSSKIAKFQAQERAAGKDLSDVGSPVRVCRIFGCWLGVKWSRLSPQVAFALLADRDADRIA